MRSLAAALLLVTMAQRLCAENAGALYLQARELLRRDQVAPAVALLEKCVAAQPSNSSYHQWLGRAIGLQVAENGVLAGLSGVSRVRGALEKAIELDRNNLEARRDLAVMYRVVPRILGGSREKAAEQVAIIRRSDPVLATQIEGDFLARDKRYKEALAMYEKAVVLNPSRARPHVSMATVYQEIKRWDDAFVALDRALAMEPSYPVALYHFGRTAASSGLQLDRGEKYLRSYLAMPLRKPELEYPPLASAHFRLGWILERKGDVDGARAEYEEVLSIDPDHKKTRAAIARLPKTKQTDRRSSGR
ncbi:MAG: tetratricopeptide repeat protein [Chthoniobacterales bacterium]